MRKRLIGIYVVGLCFLYYLVVGILVSFQPPQTINNSELQRIFTVPLKYFAPEQQEHQQYLIDIISTPLICASLYWVMARRSIKKRRKTFAKYHFVTLMAVFLLIYLIVIVFQLAPFKYLRSSGFVQAPLLTLLVCITLFVTFYFYKPLSKTDSKIGKIIIPTIYFLVGLSLIGLIMAETVFNENEPFIRHVHFVAYFDSVVQTYLGKSALVHFNPQYGLYAWLLNPIFQLTGLSVLKFTLVMSLLKGLAFLSILILLYQIIPNKLVALTGFTTIVFYTRIRLPIELGLDPYLQYSPHRILFPTIFMLSLANYLFSKNKGIKTIFYVLTTLLSSISVLWNPDTGIVVVGTWMIVLCYSEFLTFKTRRAKALLSCLRHIMVVLFGVGLVIGIFSLATYLQTGGTWPDFVAQASVTNLFYFYGFFALPMMPLHPWNLVVMAYIIGIFIAVSYLLDVNGYTYGWVWGDFEAQTRNQLILALSILGVGLFNYYVGRSHEYNLIPISWPMLILLTIYIDMLSHNLSGILYRKYVTTQTRFRVAWKQSFQVILFVGFFSFTGSSLVSIGIHLPGYINVIRNRQADIKKGTSENLLNDIKFIQETAQAGDKVIILSDFAPEMYLSARIPRPLNISGFGELILTNEVDQIKDFLRDPPEEAKIYWDPRFEDINENSFFNINPKFYSNLRPIKYSPDHTLILFQETP